MAKKSTETALVVDDATFMRAYLKDILIEYGFSRVEEAKNGTEGVELFKHLKPDLVTMDVVMPEMDGLQALKQILQGDDKARVVMVTAVGQEDQMRQALRSGAMDYVVKPFQVDVIQKVLDRIFNT